MNKNYSMVASDKIFATLECNGRVVARLSERNFSSIDEVVRTVRRIAGQFVGLARLVIRNQTQGWSTQVAIAAPRRQAAQAMPRVDRNGQYLIPWQVA